MSSPPSTWSLLLGPLIAKFPATPACPKAFVPEIAHADTAALLVLQAILGGWHGVGPLGGPFVSRSNRLYRGLVDTKLATDVGASPPTR